MAGLDIRQSVVAAARSIANALGEADSEVRAAAFEFNADVGAAPSQSMTFDPQWFAEFDALDDGNALANICVDQYAPPRPADAPVEEFQRVERVPSNWSITEEALGEG